MPYIRRPTWPDSDREDYVIRCEGLDVGRAYKSRGPHGDRFVWTIYMNGRVPQVASVPIAGEAVELEQAAAAFNRAISSPHSRSTGRGSPSDNRGLGAIAPPTE